MERHVERFAIVLSLALAGCAASPEPQGTLLGQSQTQPGAVVKQSGAPDTPPDAARDTMPAQSPPSAVIPPASDAIVVPGEGAVARCCPRGASAEQCQNFLGSDVAQGREAQCGGEWNPAKEDR